MRGSTDNLPNCVTGNANYPENFFSAGGGGYEGGGRTSFMAQNSGTTANFPIAQGSGRGGSGFVAASAVVSSIEFTPDGTGTPPNITDADYVAASYDAGIAGITGGSPGFGTEEAGGNGLVVIEWIIDTDNDGFADKMDTDSDDDGCSDALEGGSNIVFTDLDANDMIDGDVDMTCGVPVAVSNSGQTVGSSRDDADSPCCDPTVSGFTNTDGDDLVDICDKDDDNDGILDEDELQRQVFTFTGSDQMITAPTGAIGMTVKIWGAGGGHEIVNSAVSAGAGGYTSAEFDNSIVTAGSQFTIVVGEGGNNAVRPGTGVGVYGFGGIGTHDQGGGLSGIFTGSAAVVATDQARALAVAGGGGGADDDGGGSAFTGGTNGNGMNSGGETDMMGSTDMLPNCVAGNPAYPENFFSAGGGGYEGGGRTSFMAQNSGTTANCPIAQGSGKGGSGFVAASAIASSIEFTPDGIGTPPNTTDADYMSASYDAGTAGVTGGSGGFGAEEAGGNGLVVIEWIIDTDGDGVANNLDNDSDDDGCPDAIEGGGIIMAANLDTDDRITGGVDATCGVPTAVGTSGQTVGSSQDNTVQSGCTKTVAENDINQVPEGTNAVGNLLTNDIDPQGDTRTVTSITIPGVGVVAVDPMTGSGVQTIAGVGTIEVQPDGSYEFIPNAGFTGDVPAITYEIEDATGATDTATLDIDVIPTDDTPDTDAPPIANDDTNTTERGVEVNGNLISNDFDPDTPQDDLVVTQITIPGVGTVPVNPMTGSGVQTIPGVGTIEVQLDGSYTFDPDPSYIGKTPPIAYTVTDPDGGTTTASLVVDVVPDTGDNTFANDDASVGTAGADQTGNVITNDNDPEGDMQMVSGGTTSDGTSITPGTAVTLPSGGMLTLNTDGTYTYEPASGFIGTEAVTYTVSDGNGGTDTATLYLTTLPDTKAENDINQVPAGTNAVGNLLTNDIDPQGDTRTVTSITISGVGTVAVDPTTGSGVQAIPGVGTIEVQPDGSYEFIPVAGFTGEVPSITYEIEDATGAKDTATLAIEVFPDDDIETVDASPIANDDTNTTEQDTDVNGNLIDSNDSDPDTPQDDLVVTQIMIPGVGTVAVDPMTGSGVQTISGVGTIEVQPNGSYTFDPAPDFVGKTPPIEYTIADPDGGADSASLIIDVVPDTGDNTFANDDTSVDRIDVDQTGNVITNDNDPEGDTQMISGGTTSDGTSITPGMAVNLPSGGMLTLNSDGSYTYMPATGFVGTEAVTYTVSDGNGGTDIATLYMTTLPIINFLPVELLYFEAKADFDHINLTWSTASELNNSHFELERSEDSKVFKAIGRVAGQGTTLELTEYAYEDESLVVNVPYYYRLKQVDYDGTFEYSEIRSAQIEEAEKEMELYPNPIGNAAELQVRFYASELTKEFVIMDIYNRSILQVKQNLKATGWNTMSIDITILPAGTYILLDKEGSGKRFVKTRE